MPDNRNCMRRATPSRCWGAVPGRSRINPARLAGRTPHCCMEWRRTCPASGRATLAWKHCNTVTSC